jgi:hypothetical protein
MVTVARGRVAAIVLVVGLGGALRAEMVDAAPTCQFAVDGRNLALTVALRGNPGSGLSVDWGDGERSTIARTLTATRGRAFVRHTYAAAGSYPLQISTAAPGGAGCGLGMTADVPYQTNVSADMAAILPDAAAPDSSDSLDDGELGVALPQDVERSSPPAAGGGSLIGGLIRALGSLFGLR